MQKYVIFILAFFGCLLHSSGQVGYQSVRVQGYIPTGACTLPNDLVMVNIGSGVGAGLYQCILGNWAFYNPFASGGGATTPATTTLLKGNGLVNGVVAAVPGTDYFQPLSINGLALFSTAGAPTALALVGTGTGGVPTVPATSIPAGDVVVADASGGMADSGHPLTPLGTAGQFPAVNAGATAYVPVSLSGDCTASTTTPGQLTCNPASVVTTYTASATAATTDTNDSMNCSSACVLTVPAPVKSGQRLNIISTGNTLATANLISGTWNGKPTPWSGTASISTAPTCQLNISALTSGVVNLSGAQYISDGGVNVLANSFITSQCTGPTGGIGTYTLAVVYSTAVSSEAMTGSGNVPVLASNQWTTLVSPDGINWQGSDFGPNGSGIGYGASGNMPCYTYTGEYVTPCVGFNYNFSNSSLIAGAATGTSYGFATPVYQAYSEAYPYDNTTNVFYNENLINGCNPGPVIANAVGTLISAVSQVNCFLAPATTANGGVTGLVVGIDDYDNGTNHPDTVAVQPLSVCEVSNCAEVSGNFVTNDHTISAAILPAASFSGSISTASTCQLTGSVTSGNPLTAGQVISGTGVTAGTAITASCTTPGAYSGTYTLNTVYSAPVATEAMTANSVSVVAGSTTSTLTVTAEQQTGSCTACTIEPASSFTASFSAVSKSNGVTTNYMTTTGTTYVGQLLTGYDLVRGTKVIGSLGNGLYTINYCPTAGGVPGKSCVNYSGGTITGLLTLNVPVTGSVAGWHTTAPASGIIPFTTYGDTLTDASNLVPADTQIYLQYNNASPTSSPQGLGAGDYTLTTTGTISSPIGPEAMTGYGTLGCNEPIADTNYTANGFPPHTLITSINGAGCTAHANPLATNTFTLNNVFNLASDNYTTVVHGRGEVMNGIEFDFATVNPTDSLYSMKGLWVVLNGLLFGGTMPINAFEATGETASSGDGGLVQGNQGLVFDGHFIPSGHYAINIGDPGIATSSVPSLPSPIEGNCGDYYNGSSSIADCWNRQIIYPTGTPTFDEYQVDTLITSGFAHHFVMRYDHGVDLGFDESNGFYYQLIQPGTTSGDTVYKLPPYVGTVLGVGYPSTPTTNYVPVVLSGTNGTLQNSEIADALAGVTIGTATAEGAGTFDTQGLIYENNGTQIAGIIQNGGTAVTPTSGAVNLIGGTNITLSTSGNAITIAASGSVGSAWSSITSGSNTSGGTWGSNGTWTFSGAAASGTPSVYFSGAPLTSSPYTPVVQIGSGSLPTLANESPMLFISAPSGYSNSGYLSAGTVNGGSTLAFYFTAGGAGGTSGSFTTGISSASNYFVTGGINNYYAFTSAAFNGTVNTRICYGGSAGFVVVESGSGNCTNSGAGATGTFGAAVYWSNATQTTVSCSTSGTAVFSQPEQGAADKRVLVHLNACVGTASYTFPAVFTNTPSIFGSNNVATSIATSVSATAITVTGSTTTGMLIAEDY